MMNGIVGVAPSIPLRATGQSSVGLSRDLQELNMLQWGVAGELGKCQSDSRNHEPT
jgi:hypothetical protein